MASGRLKVSGMTCDHCRGRVEKAVAAVTGVYAVYVDLAEGTVEADFDSGKTDLDALAEAVRSVGYAAEVSS